MAWTTEGCEVTISKESGSSVLFCKDGQTTIRQVETVKTTEIRGLTKNAALSKVGAPSYSNDYAETTYYQIIGGETYQFLGRTGTETRHTARRVDETNQWVYTKTETEFELNVDDPADLGWTTSAGGNTLTASGVEVPISKDKTASYQYTYVGKAICSTVLTEVVEYRHVTESGAANYVNSSLVGATMHYHNYVKNAPSNPNIGGLYGTVAYSIFMHGTDTQYSARKVSDQEGWTVTKTTKTYGWAGTAHSALVDGWELGNAV